MRHAKTHPRQRGFGVIAAIFVLVILAALAAAIVRFGVGAQTTGARAVLAVRASQAARAGTEWGLYQAFKGSWTTCSGASQTLDLVAEQGFRVTVSCDSRSFNEGQLASGAARAVRIYTIDAVACNLGSSCPDNSNATQSGYVERRRQVQVASCSPHPTATSEGPGCD
jgi:MSHA biogenesis protein MshP